MSTFISDIKVFHDRPRDVVYITLGDNVPCVSIEDPEIEGLHYRYAIENGRLAGVTIVWFSHQDKARLTQKMPFPVRLP